MRVVCGRLKSDFRYSKDIVYNNFPWPCAMVEPVETIGHFDKINDLKAKIEGTAQAILDARDIYPEASLADMYGNLFLFPELQKAHRANDAVVLEAYGFPKDATESEIVARLFGMYRELTEKI
ncbi:MAG: methylase [Bacteroidales bacterium]|nr:methylase [Bacteroidales bacterium]